nr:MAG TPA: hypothetical protein [Bacteriophage sp.]
MFALRSFCVRFVCRCEILAKCPGYRDSLMLVMKVYRVQK